MLLNSLWIIQINIQRKLESDNSIPPIFVLFLSFFVPRELFFFTLEKCQKSQIHGRAILVCSLAKQLLCLFIIRGAFNIFKSILSSIVRLAYEINLGRCVSVFSEPNLYFHAISFSWSIFFLVPQHVWLK